MFGFPLVDYPDSSCVHVVCRILTVSRKSEYHLLIGVSAPGIKPDGDGCTHEDSSSYCMMSDGDVYAAGQRISRHCLPASSIIQPDLFEHRRWDDRAFAEWDDVIVTLDCSAHTLRLQSPTVDHTITSLQQHHTSQSRDCCKC